MIDLPIAGRELRVAARSTKTYRTRLATAGIALLFFFWLYWIFSSRGGGAGSEVFQSLTNLCLIYCLLTGVILTADCVSAEKREGTLGFLFLTSLKPVDIAIGNLLATALKAFYGLLAAFPVLGLALVMGGVPFAEFVRVCLALVSALVFSLTFSLLVSCLSEKYLAATSRALLGLFFFAVVIPVACPGLSRRLGPGSPLMDWVDWLRLLSPSTALNLASMGWTSRFNDFWWSLLMVNCLSALWLILACFILPRVWQDDSGTTGVIGWWQRVRRWRPRGGTRWDPGRARLLRWSPYCWLASRRSQESTRLLLQMVAGVSLAALLGRRYLAGVMGGLSPEFVAQVFAWVWVVLGAHGVLLFKIATLSSQRLAEDRKSGALELLLATPLSDRQIVRGQWLALARQLTGPALATLGLHALFLWAFLTMFALNQNIPGGAREVLEGIAHPPADNPEIWWFVKVGCVAIAGAALLICVEWIALGWAGMWLALRVARPIAVAWAALALVLVPPAPVFVLAIFAGDSLSFQRNDIYWAWYCLVCGFGLVLLNALLVIGICRYKLRRHFRVIVSEGIRRPVVSLLARTKRGVTRFTLAGATAALVLAAFYAGERWRGQRAWRRLAQEYAARGEVLTTHLAAPPPVPDAENFGAAEFFQPLFAYRPDADGNPVWEDGPGRQALLTLTVTGQASTWRVSTNKMQGAWALQLPVDLRGWRDYYRSVPMFAPLVTTNDAIAAVARVLGSFDADLQAIDRLSRLPLARFPLHYEEDQRGHVQHWPVLRNIAEILRLRAVVALAREDGAAALADIEFMLRLAAALRLEHGLGACQVRQGILLVALQPVWEGLAAHGWNDAQLRRLEDLFRLDVLAGYPLAMRVTMVTQAGLLDHLTGRNESFMRGAGFSPELGIAMRFYPEGWRLLNQAGLLATSDHVLGPVIDPVARRAYPAKAGMVANKLLRAGVAIDPVFSMIAQPWLIQWLASAGPEFAHAQVALDEARIACALERWRQAHGEFPVALEALAPDNLPAVSRDPMTGNESRYRRPAPGRFVLYSVGWNERDDDGQPARIPKATQEFDLREGDWVWSYPEK